MQVDNKIAALTTDPVTGLLIPTQVLERQQQDIQTGPDSRDYVSVAPAIIAEQASKTSASKSIPSVVAEKLKSKGKYIFGNVISDKPQLDKSQFVSEESAGLHDTENAAIAQQILEERPSEVIESEPVTLPVEPVSVVQSEAPEVKADAATPFETFKDTALSIVDTAVNSLPQSTGLRLALLTTALALPFGLLLMLLKRRPR